MVQAKRGTEKATIKCKNATRQTVTQEVQDIRLVVKSVKKNVLVSFVDCAA